MVVLFLDFVNNRAEMKWVRKIHHTFFGNNLEAFWQLVNLIPEFQHLGHKYNVLDLVWFSFRIRLPIPIANNHGILNRHIVISIKLIIGFIEVLVVDDLAFLALESQVGIPINLLTFQRLKIFEIKA